MEGVEIPEILFLTTLASLYASRTDTSGILACPAMLVPLLFICLAMNSLICSSLTPNGGRSRYASRLGRGMILVSGNRNLGNGSPQPSKNKVVDSRPSDEICRGRCAAKCNARTAPTHRPPTATVL